MTAGSGDASHYGLLFLLLPSINGFESISERHDRCRLSVLHRYRITSQCSRHKHEQCRHNMGQRIFRDTRTPQAKTDTPDLGCLDFGEQGKSLEISPTTVD